jgi:hypothetical protein
MNALQPHRDPSPTPIPSRQPRVRSRSRQSTQRAPHQALVIETSMKLGVNLILAAVAISTLARLIPYNTEQQADLQRLQVEVAEAGSQVAGLQKEFDRHFDPQQALNVMQEQNIRLNPKQRQVVWLDPDTQKPADADQADQPSQSPTMAPD